MAKKIIDEDNFLFDIVLDAALQEYQAVLTSVQRCSMVTNVE
jgi:hypothetical protein